MDVVEFPRVSALVAHMREEASSPGRFPVRFMRVNSLEAWRELLEALQAECELYCLSTCCAGEDVLPYVGDLLPHLQASSARKMAVLPVGELLRLDPDTMLIRELAVWEDPGHRRVYVPILAADDLLNGQLDRVGRYRSGECSVWSVPGLGELYVEASPADLGAPAGTMIHGVQCYLRLWEEGGRQRLFFVTELAPHLETRRGAFSFIVHTRAFALLRTHVVGAQKLDSAWGTEEQWAWLVSHAGSEETLSRLAGRLLNALRFEPALLASWRRRRPHERWLIWLWARAEGHGGPGGEGSLARRLLLDAPSFDRVAAVADLYPLRNELSPEEMMECRAALRYLGLAERSSAFWADFAELEEPSRRLKALPGLSLREQEEIVRAVAELLRRDAPEAQWLPFVERTFPELATYLSTFPYANDHVRSYMSLYTRSRVMDEPSEALSSLGQEWAREGKVWQVPPRDGELRSIGGEATRWADGLGVEWMGLLYTLLNNQSTIATAKLCRANLPSSTAFNRGWESESEVSRDLDHMAHQPEYAYPTSLVRQLRLIGDLAQELCQAGQSRTVIVTGDHGLTRFAAGKRRVAPPPGYQAHKWGRYALPTEGEAIESCAAGEAGDAQWLTCDGYLVLANHDLFQGGRRTSGEVHGGATIEEVLVPVIAISPRSQECPRIVAFEEKVDLDVHGAAFWHAELDGPARELYLILGGQTFAGRSIGGHRWQVSLRDVPAGDWKAQLRCERGKIAEVTIETVRGIQEEDLGL